MGDNFNPRQIRASMRLQSTAQLKSDLRFYNDYRAHENEKTKLIEVEIKRELDRRGESYE